MQAMSSRSQERITQMNSSVVAFRELIESLRHKNRSSFSDVNPESEKSNPSHTFVSEKEPVRLPSSSRLLNLSSPQLGEDDAIKLKPKSNVAGRDILHKKVSQLPHTMFNSTAESFKLPPKSKEPESSPETVSPQQPTPIIGQVKHSNPPLENKSMLPQRASIPRFQNTTQGEKIKQSFNSRFNQKKFNAKISNQKKIKDIDEEVVESYCRASSTLSQYSPPNEIFEFFEGLLSEIDIIISAPLIKKFKNCVYFGHQIMKDEKYEGFLYFFEEKIYYGEFMNSQKHGQGVEISWKEQVTFKGIFKEGQKSGKFYVRKQEEEYIGFLEKGLYHGHGKLTSKDCVYEGQFFQGEKHGLGEQFFIKTGLRFTGYFQRGAFTKRSRSNHGTSHQSPLERGVTFKNSRRTNMSQTQSHFRKTSKDSFNALPATSRGLVHSRNPHPEIDETEISIHPFSTNKPAQFDRKRMAYNKEKIRSFMPVIGGRDAMPEICQDFDYSFDVSSKRESEDDQFNFARGKRAVPEDSLQGHFSRIEEEGMETNSYEEPLPVPCFYRQ